jgi:hypothetical protein
VKRVIIAGLAAAGLAVMPATALAKPTDGVRHGVRLVCSLQAGYTSFSLYNTLKKGDETFVEAQAPNGAVAVINDTLPPGGEAGADFPFSASSVTAVYTTPKGATKTVTASCQ